jgi:DNA-binding CsgD family transcriptional regulator
MCTGVISTIVGYGVAGHSGDSGPATSAQLYQPASVSVDSSGNLYIADDYTPLIAVLSHEWGAAGATCAKISASIRKPKMMKRHVLAYGIIGGILITLLQWTEYRFLIIEHSLEIYGGLVAAIFAVLGIWLGRKLSATRQKIIVKEVLIQAENAPSRKPFALDERKRDDLGITRREMEILELVAQGMSNREIAGKLFVSENTVKTDKLGAKRRTQAVQLSKQFGLLP